jgi:hypothetical protein
MTPMTATERINERKRVLSPQETGVEESHSGDHQPHEGGACESPSNVSTVVHGRHAIWVGVCELTRWSGRVSRNAGGVERKRDRTSIVGEVAMARLCWGFRMEKRGALGALLALFIPK